MEFYESEPDEASSEPKLSLTDFFENSSIFETAQHPPIAYQSALAPMQVDDGDYEMPLQLLMEQNFYLSQSLAHNKKHLKGL